MELAIVNGKCHTMDDAGTVVEAIAMKDGRITATGTSEEIRAAAGPEAEIIDLGGKTVVPGFNDSHMHLLSYGHSKSMAYLDDCGSMDELIETVKKHIAENDIPAGEWVEGRGWNETDYPEGRLPNRHDLDKISEDHMIALGRSCSFICVVNTKTLKELGLYDNPPKREVGSVEVDENGVPTGVFIGEATQEIYSRIPKLGVEKIKKAIVKACNDYLTAGITSVETDDFELTRAGSFQEILQAYFELDRDGELPLRIYKMLYLPEKKLMEEFFKMGLKTGDGSPFFRIGAFKLMADGSLGTRCSALLEPYHDDPSTLGENIFPQKELNEMTRMAYDHGLNVVMDGMGDRGIYMALKAFEPIVTENRGKDLRFGIDHCQITTEGLIEEYARLGVVGGLELVFVKSDIEIAADRVGDHRASLSYNWKRFLDNGVHIAAGCDSPVEDFNPMYGIDGAVNRRDWSDLPEEGWYPEQCLTVEQAVRAYTTGSAYASFEEDVKGSLEVGKYADMAVLSEDIFAIDKKKIKDVKVEKTILDGKVVFDRASAAE
ncbi:amidohydrolase [Bacilliculturomica massiliensis]|uniref:amidohydrolase n=1 Tax=Bacilliculturomica massiliensis TaxID=1917867 RepID=UPI0013EF4D11|nr:amidohydrolase [Bacilliculturomica massiliensis]